MAFATGSFTGADGFDVVMQKLHDFAVTTCGWTSNYNTFPYLSISKSQCWANFYFREDLTVDDTENTGNPVPDYRIMGHLGSGFTSNVSAATQYISQPGSLVNAMNGGNDAVEQVQVNDFKGPYANYWFFSGADGEPDYIIMVIQLANGRFCKLSFGNVDQKGADYVGGAFLEGIFWNWWFPSGSNPPGENSSGTGSDYYTGNHKWLGDQSANYNIYLGVLDVVNPMISHALHNTLQPLMFRITLFPSYNLGSVVGDNWLYAIFWVGTSPVNGISAMFEVPLFQNVGADTRLYYIGTLPGVRWLSMMNRFEAEQVMLGSDEWIVFPFKHALPWTSEPFAQKLSSSGPFGYACKVNS